MPKTKKKKQPISVPYVKGYKPPTAEQSLAAITYPPVTSPTRLPAHLRPTSESYQLINPPLSRDDWLAQYSEEGQSYHQFIQECPWMSKRKWKQLRQDFNSKGTTIQERYPQGVIYLLKLGNFSNSDYSSSSSSKNGGPLTAVQPNFDALFEYVKIFYNLPVQVLEGIELVKKEGGTYSIVYTPSLQHEEGKRRTSTRQIHHTIEYRYDKHTKHTQLHINSILLALRQHIPINALLLMALTTFDLYDEQPDLFVAGTAAGNARVGVFSFARYDPTIEFSSEFWYQINRKSTLLLKNPKTSHEAIVLQRSCKLLIHEIAHLLGVDHCIWYECCMNGAGHLEEDFHQPSFLCPIDLHKLETLCGFDIVKRYENMLQFFEKYNLSEESKWIKQRLEYIKNN